MVATQRFLQPFDGALLRLHLQCLAGKQLTKARDAIKLASAAWDDY